MTFPHVQCEMAQSMLPLYSALCVDQIHVRNQKVLSAYTDRIRSLLHWKRYRMFASANRQGRAVLETLCWKGKRKLNFLQFSAFTDRF